MYVRLIRTGVADGVAAGNGALAGLVAITAPCAFVAPWAAVVIGLIAGLVMLWGEGFVEKTLKADDPVGAITVHGILGFVGLLMVGVFADGTYGVSGIIAGNFNQFVIQLIGAVAIAAWALDHGLRHVLDSEEDRWACAHRDEEQTVGLDISEHGMHGLRTGSHAGTGRRLTRRLKQWYLEHRQGDAGSRRPLTLSDSASLAPLRNSALAQSATRLPAPRILPSDVIAIHHRDEVQANLLGAHRAEHSPMFVQPPKPSSSMASTIDHGPVIAFRLGPAAADSNAKSSQP